MVETSRFHFVIRTVVEAVPDLDRIDFPALDIREESAKAESF